jgi:RecA-family ATPase
MRFAGEQPAGAQPVVLVCTEESTGEMVLRIEAAIGALAAAPVIVGRNLYLLEARTRFSLARKSGSENRPVTSEAVRLFDTIVQVGAKLVCLDPLIELHELSESDNGDMHFVASTLREVARRADAAILITHHTGKLEGGKVTLGSARGASSLVGAVRAAGSVSERWT